MLKELIDYWSYTVSNQVLIDGSVERSFLSLGQSDELSSQIVEVAMSDYFWGLNSYNGLPLLCGKLVCIFQPRLWLFCSRQPSPKTRLICFQPKRWIPVWWSPKRLERRKGRIWREWRSWKQKRRRTIRSLQPNRVLGLEGCGWRFYCNLRRCMGWCSYTSRARPGLLIRLIASSSKGSGWPNQSYRSVDMKGT